MKSRSRFKYVKQTPGGCLDGMGVPLSTLSVCVLAYVVSASRSRTDIYRDEYFVYVCLCIVRQGYNMLGPTGTV